MVNHPQYSCYPITHASSMLAARWRRCSKPRSAWHASIPSLPAGPTRDPDVREGAPGLGDLQADFNFDQPPNEAVVLSPCPGGDFAEGAAACSDAGY